MVDQALAEGLLGSLATNSSRGNGRLGLALALGRIGVVDLATQVTLVLQEAWMSEDTIPKVIKSVVEKLALE